MRLNKAENDEITDFRAQIKIVTEYLLRFYPETASRTLQEMEQKLALLAEMPEMCEVYASNPFYRRTVAGKYLVFYHVNERQRTVDIYRVLRGAWDIEKQFREHD